MNKQDFPIFKNNPDLVYLDNAATSQKPQCVIDAEIKFYEKYNSNIHRGIYRISEKATEAYENTRFEVSKLINAEPEEIIFTSGTTHSINEVVWGFAPEILEKHSNDAVVVTEMEHHSNFIPWQQLANQMDIKFEIVRITKDYRLDQSHLHKFLKKGNVKILSITHMSNTLGTINPLEDIVKVVRKLSPQTMIIVDAAQSIPHFSVDVKKLDIDFLAFSAHKMLGPTGVGVLFGKKYLLEKMLPIFTGGGMIEKVLRDDYTPTLIPQRFEAGTPNIAGVIGFGEAVKYIQKIGYKKINEAEKKLTEYFLSQMSKYSYITLYGPKDIKNRGCVFILNVDKIHSHDLAQILDQNNIAVRAGHHCNQILIREILKVSSTIRASFYFYNDKNDIDNFFKAIQKAYAMFNRQTI